MALIYHLVQKILERMDKKEGFPIHLGQPIYILLNYERIRGRMDGAYEGWISMLIKLSIINFLTKL